MGMFEYLKYGVSLVLVVVGLKMLFAKMLEVPNHVTLILIIVILISSILISILKLRRDRLSS